jgi:hypothetical protein
MAVQPLAKAFTISHQPGAERFRGAGEMVGCGYRVRMTTGGHCVDQAPDDGGGKSADVKPCRQQKHETGLAKPPQIDHRERPEDAKAHDEGVRLQRGNRRDQRAHARRYSHGHIEHVVDHQRGGGQQTPVWAEVLVRHRVGTAALRIRGNGLAIREIDNAQHDHDEAGDRQSPGKPGRAQRDQDGERGLGSVGCGAEGVETEDGNARRWPHLLLPVFGRCERFPEQEVRQSAH